MRAALLVALSVVSVSAQGPPARVSVARAEIRKFAPTMAAVGQAEPSQTARASAEIEGRVAAVAVDAGSPVDTTSALITMDTGRLEIAQRRAAAELRLEQKKLDELEAGSRPDEVVAAKAALAEAEARLREAQREHERVKNLVKGGSSSAEELSLAQAAEEKAKAARDEKQARLGLVVSGPREETKEQQRAEVGIKQAALDRVKDDLKRADVRSPIKGVIIERKVDPGHVVMPGAALFEIAAIDPIRVVIPVPERLVGLLQKDGTLPVSFDAFPGKSFTAKVEAVVPTGDRDARTFPVRLLVENDHGRLLPGMLARATLPLSRPGKRLAVPRDAVIRQPGAFLVWTVKDGKARAVDVVPGHEQDGWIAVTGKIAEGDTVVTAGNARLRKGQSVVVVPGGSPNR